MDEGTPAETSQHVSLLRMLSTVTTSANVHQSAETSMSATMELRTSEGEKVRLMRRLFSPLLVQPPCRSWVLSFELLEG